MDIDEGWLYVSTEILDDWNRNVEYSYTFPLDGRLTKEVTDIVTDSGVPFWATGTCKRFSRICADVSWTLEITAPDRVLEYDGWDAFPEGYDVFSQGTTALALSLFGGFKLKLNLLEEVFLTTETDDGFFNLRSRSIIYPKNGRREHREVGTEYLERVREILNDYDLAPYQPTKIRPMVHGKCIHLVLKERYGNSLSLWWGVERPPWVDSMVQRLRGVFDEAYSYGTPVANPMIPTDPDGYSLSDGLKRIILTLLGEVGKTLPIDEGDFIDLWGHILEHRDMLQRRICIGRDVDPQEMESYSLAAREMEQFRFININSDRINQILKEQ